MKVLIIQSLDPQWPKWAVISDGITEWFDTEAEAIRERDREVTRIRRAEHQLSDCCDEPYFVEANRRGGQIVGTYRVCTKCQKICN